MENSKVPPVPKKVPPIPEKKYTRIEFLDKEANRAPPHAIELEQVILGAILVDKKAMPEVSGILKPHFFYNDDHSLIYKAMENLYKKNIGIDLRTTSEELHKMGKLGFVGGDFYLINISNLVSSSAHIEFHARIVIQKYVLRRLIAMSDKTINGCYYRDPDIFELMEDIGDEIANIVSYVIQAEDNISADAKKELYEKVKSVQKGEPPGVYSGLEAFDEWSGGFQRRELITIAARPGMGKTTAVLSIAGKASFEKEIPLAFFSLEMAEADLKARLASRGTGISYTNIRLGKLTSEQLTQVLDYYDYIDKSCLHIVDRTNKLETIIKRIKELVLRDGVKMVMIDYVQLMKLTKSSSDRTSDLSTITRELKALANELNIPIIIIAQLSRGVDTRASKRPVLADLKQSGSIEEDSDTVIFLLRMAYYEQSMGNMVPPHLVGKTEFIVAKGRNIGVRDFWTFLDFNNYDFRTL